MFVSLREGTLLGFSLVIISALLTTVHAANLATNLVCGTNQASIEVTDGNYLPTEGRMYVDGHYSTAGCFIAASPWVLNVSIGQCGTAYDTNFTVIILHDKDYYLETIDSAKTFACAKSLYATTMTNVSAYVPAGEIIPIIGQTANIPALDINITLVLKNTSTGAIIDLNSDPVVLGGNVTMEIIPTPYAHVKIEALSCWAAGVTKNSSTETWKYLYLISNSCPSVPFFTVFTQDSTTKKLSATFPMFLMTPRHDTNRTMGFFCTVKACDKNSTDCGPKNCSNNEMSWGRRRRRAAEEEEYIQSNLDTAEPDYSAETEERGPASVALGYFVHVIDPESDLTTLAPPLVEVPKVKQPSPKAPIPVQKSDANGFCLNQFSFVVLAVLVGLIIIAFCCVSACFFAYVRNKSATRGLAAKTVNG
ncbi:uncharacterized protein LOC106179981 [Lingula anatina]|uniref:Uncharacterized protein LOC106179981 n=1 Tax=Lingula anatina TaxID=7574 RepID=A0A1S3K9Z3_LINAN|nr:uncharacterized protein LOC106179981 [Lingula anatina]|eukprot:XP_013419269.1 uncharacterized protein LOC106179981 [Lingula anatina]